MATGSLVIKRTGSSSGDSGPDPRQLLTFHFSPLFIPTNINLDVCKAFPVFYFIWLGASQCHEFLWPNNSFSKFRIRERAVTYPISDLRKWIVAKYTPKPGIQRCNACEKRGEMIQVMGQSEQARKGMHRFTSTFLQSVLMKETQPAPPLTNRKGLIIIHKKL